MFVLVEKKRNVVLMMGNQLDYMDNGYPRLIEENIAFPTEMVHIYEVELVPEEVASEKYCYTPEEGFYKNPDWREPNPFGVTDEQYNAIIDEYTLSLIESGVL